MVEDHARDVSTSPDRAPALPEEAARSVRSWWRWIAASPALWTPAAILALASAIFIVHAPVLDHYFFGDDFVPLADIATRSTPDYLRDLFLLRDLTPNWRLLPGLFYLGAFRAFGLNAFPFLLANVVLHIGTAVLIFVLVRRATGAVWMAFLAGAFFGVTAAHARTVAQVTAFNNVLAGFLIMLSLITLYEGLLRRQLRWWGVASVLSFAGAIASNEAVAVLAPVPGLLIIWSLSESDRWWRQRGELVRIVAIAAPYAAIGGAALIGFGVCRCTEAARVYSADVMFENFWIYLGRLLYPVGLEFPGNVGDAHLVAGLVTASLMLALLLRGPALARICVAFLLLALIPYLPLDFALAERYVYIAAIPFSILAAFVFMESSRLAGRAAPALPAMLVIVAAGVLGLSSWQTWSQNEFIADGSSHWRQLVTGLQERHPKLPGGSRVYVRGGPLEDPLLQFFVVPSVANVLWGDVRLQIVPQDTHTVCVEPGEHLYVMDFDAGRFTPVPVIRSPRGVAVDTSGERPVIAVTCPS